MKQTIALLTGIFIGLIAVYAAVVSPYFASASSPAGFPADVGTSTIAFVSTTPIIAFPTSTNCAARIISTASSSIKITFSDRMALYPSDARGHWQSASTTVVYDSGQFGCDTVRVYSYTAQPVTILETRQ